jgi:hypothetical protein
MVQWLPPPLRRLNKHPQIVARRSLPDKFSKRFWPKRGVDVLGPFVGRGDAVFVSHADFSPLVLDCPMDPETSSG